MNKSALPIQLALVAASAFVLVGCGEPVSGTWESDGKIDSHRSEFTLDGDLNGDGDFYFPAVPSGSVKCRGDISGKVKRDLEYRFTIKFKGDQGCDAIQDFEADCELIKDDTELDCGSDGGTWNRVE